VTFNVHDQRHTSNGWSFQEHHSCAGRVSISSRDGHVAAANQLALVFGQLMDENLLFDLHEILRADLLAQQLA
jgi:hypothetical protein